MADRHNIQGLVARSYQQDGYLHSRHLMFTFGQQANARGFIACLLPRVAHAAMDMAAAPDAVANISLSWSGLGALGVLEPGADAAFPSDFREGPEAAITGDSGSSAPDQWWEGQFRSEQVHLVLHLYGRTGAAADAAVQEVRATAAASGSVELIPTRGNTPLAGTSLAPDPRELHFGYLDGFSQPDVDWDDRRDRLGQLDLRNFLLGYATNDAPSRPHQLPWDEFARDGSYLVLRWLYQDVAAFERYLTDNAGMVAHLSPADPRELLAAKMMGRWRDGTPMVLSPDASSPTLAGEAFDYSSDRDGLRCPFAAHIRIANHRDDPLSHANEVMFGSWKPRVLRRGMSYGPRLQGTDDDGIDRGIIGLFFCADINLQFYPLMRWMRRTSFRDVFEVTGIRRQDPVTGNRTEASVDRSFVVPATSGDVVLPDLPAFTRTKGTLFLLMPGMKTLARLAGPAKG